MAALLFLFFSPLSLSRRGVFWISFRGEAGSLRACTVRSAVRRRQVVKSSGQRQSIDRAPGCAGRPAGGGGREEAAEEAEGGN